MKSKIKLVLLTAMITLGAIFQFTSTAKAVTYTTNYIRQENWYLAYPQSGVSTQREAQFLINGETVFCIDPYTDFKSKVTMEVVDWSVMGISKETAKEISLISYFGTKVAGRTDNDWYGVTQGLIWKTLHPNDSDLCYVVTPLNPDLATTQKLWNEILADVENYKTLPSFSAQTVEVNAGETITLTDTNGVLKDMYVTDDGGLSVTISGNNLIIKGTADSSDLANITLVKKINDEDIGTSLAFYNGKDQSLAQFKISDPVQTKIRVKVNKYGSLELTKNNNYGNIVDGAVFNISSDNGYNENHTVSNGKLFVDNLLVGTYTITEVSAPYGYVVNTNTYEVEVKPDTTSKLTVTNDFDYGKLELDKTNTKYRSNKRALF